jgi:hypothetical protein
MGVVWLVLFVGDLCDDDDEDGDEQRRSVTLARGSHLAFVEAARGRGASAAARARRRSQRAATEPVVASADPLRVSLRASE